MSEELRAAYQRITELENALEDARLHIEVAHDTMRGIWCGDQILGRIHATLEPVVA